MSFLETKSFELEQLIPLIRERLADGHSVRIYPRGTSMLPMLRQGIDSVILSPLPAKLKKFDLPLYQRDNGQFVLHRIVSAEDTFTCIGDNQFDFEYHVCNDQMIALVTYFYRKNRKFSVNHFGYQLYCRYWHYSRSFRHYYRRFKIWLRGHI